MNRVTFMICVGLLSGASASGQVETSGQRPKLLAGRSVAEYAAQLDDANRVVRLRAIKSLGAMGPPAGEAIRGALDHDDPAMRYTAAVALGQIGGEPLKLSAERLQQLASDDSFRSVRMAAAYALCESGMFDEYLPFLIESLGYGERGMACSAAELIGRLGPAAIAAEPALEAAYRTHRPGAKGGDYHIGGAAMNALRKIRAESPAP